VIYHSDTYDKIRDSKRLAFESLTPTHASELFKEFSDDRIYRFIPLQRYKTVEELADRFTELSLHGPCDGTCVWLNWILKEKALGKYVGWVQATVHEHGLASIAYVVFPLFWRHGYAKEACSTIIDQLFAKTDTEMIFAEIDTRNDASIALIYKLGFKRVSEQKHVAFFNGSNSNEYRFELSRGKT